MLSKRAVLAVCRVATAALLAACVAAATAAEATPSPLSAVNDAPTELGVTLDFDPSLYASLKSAGNDVLLTDFPLDAARRVHLELERVYVMGPGTRVVVASPAGERAVPLPDVVLLRGKIQNEEDSDVYLGLSPHCCNGWIVRGEENLILSTENRGVTIGDMATLPRDPYGVCNWSCQVLIPPLQPIRFDRGPSTANGGQRAAAIAVETDTEFSVTLGGVEPAAAYVAELYGAMTTIYERDVDTILVVTYLRLWDGPDLWDQSNSVDQLYQFRNYWFANMGHIPRALAHFLSTRALGGGVAWLGVVCSYWYGYALSGNMNGYFNPDLVPDGINWDIFVVAHETGHNVGAPHTHDYDPPIDTCGLGCNDPPFDGTIMSYCHLCSGGMWNIHLEFHPLIQEIIEEYLQYDAGCDLTVSSVNIGVDLLDYEGGAGIQGTHELREPGTTNPIYTDYPILDATGSASLGTKACGRYDAAALWPNWLREVLPCIVVAAPQTDLSFVLTNGDADHSNAVDMPDINTVLTNFGTSGPQGDLNWDGAVDLVDLNIVLLAFGLIGDD